MKYHKILNIFDPEHVIPSQRPKPPSKGCYVATSIYGSYDCPQVWTLRRYRDYCLSKKYIGKLFIKLYYAISPTLVKIFKNNRLFILINKRILDYFVYKLNQIGYSDSKYDDLY